MSTEIEHSQPERPATPPDPMAHLANGAILTPQPFTSDAPVIGGFIAWFRSAWNSIATRWYLAPLLQQQNEFNLMLVDEVRALHHEQQTLRQVVTEQQARWPIIEEVSDRLIATDRDATTLAHDLAQLTAAFIRLEDRLATLGAPDNDHRVIDPPARRD